MGLRSILFVGFLFVAGCQQAQLEPDSVKVDPLDHARATAIIAKHQALVSVNAPDDLPVPLKPGDKCLCNTPDNKCGVGKTGDGTVCVRCGDCGGDGVYGDDDHSRYEAAKLLNMESGELLLVMEAKMEKDLGPSVCKNCDCGKTECTDCQCVNDNPFSSPAQAAEQPRNEIVYYTTGSNCVWCVMWERDVMPKLKERGWKITKVYETRRGQPVPNFEMYFRGNLETHTGYMDIPTFTKYFNKHKK